MLNRKSLTYLGKRIAGFVPQLLGVTLVAFLLIQLLPGDPARFILGPKATPQGLANLRRLMGLDQPLPVQYWIYLKGVVNGDLGRSWFSGQPVLDDLVQRAPATLELLTYSMILAIVVGVFLGAWSATHQGKGIIVKTGGVYTRLAGAFPDFWVSLVAIFIFFYHLRWAPAPLGRLGALDSPPPRVTGFYTIDSLLVGQMDTFWSAASHLVLPVAVLGLVVAPMLAKVTTTVMTNVLRSDFLRYSEAVGLRRWTVVRYALRNSLPPILTVIGILFVYLLGGAVLVEKVFSWGGVGQYAVQAVINSDYAAIQGFVLLAAAFTMLVYLVIDILYMVVDPRISEY